jgi:Na+-driven multidrug efflux pump
VYGLTALNMELYFASQGAGRIGWPMVATLFRFACAIAATTWAMLGTPGLDAIFAIVAFGTLGASAINVWGFKRVRWSAKP